MLQFGDNGLLNKSKEAVDKSKLAQTEELIKMDLLAAYIDAELAGQDKPSNETIKSIVESHGGTIDESNPNVIQTPNGEIKLDKILGDTSEDTKDPDEINSTIESLNNRITELNKQLQTEKNEKNKLQSQVTELTNQVADWKKKAEDGEVTIAEKDTQISNLNNQLTEKNQEVANKDSRIQELEGDVTTLTNQKNTLETQIATLQGKQATGDATASDVLAGKTFSNADGVNLTGTMVNRETLNWVPNSTDTYTLQPGYYEGGSLSPVDIMKSIESLGVLTGVSKKLDVNNELKKIDDSHAGFVITIPDDCVYFQRAYLQIAYGNENGAIGYCSYEGERSRYFEFTGDNPENWVTTRELNIAEIKPGNSYLCIDYVPPSYFSSNENARNVWMELKYMSK